MIDSIWYKQILNHVVDYCQDIWEHSAYPTVSEDEVIEHIISHSTMRNPDDTRKAIKDLIKVGILERGSEDTIVMIYPGERWSDRTEVMIKQGWRDY